jgi:hypothetical protein
VCTGDARQAHLSSPSLTDWKGERRLRPVGARAPNFC